MASPPRCVPGRFHCRGTFAFAAASFCACAFSAIRLVAQFARLRAHRPDATPPLGRGAREPGILLLQRRDVPRRDPAARQPSRRSAAFDLFLQTRTLVPATASAAAIPICNLDHAHKKSPPPPWCRAASASPVTVAANPPAPPSPPPPSDAQRGRGRGTAAAPKTARSFSNAPPRASARVFG